MTYNMKKLAFLIGLFISTSSFAQHHFQITEAAQLIWQKVYESPANATQYHEMLFNSGKFSDIAELNGKITCWLNEAPIDYKQAGYDIGQVSMFVRDGNFKCFATIQFKEGKYRVTLEQIQIIQRYDTTLSKKGEITYLDRYAINRKGTFNKMVENNSLVVLDALFKSMFEYKQATHLNDEW